MSKKVWTWLVLLIVVIVILAILAVTVWKPKPSQERVIKIGAVLGLTGPLAGLGEQFKNGALLAVEEINNQGGINGKMVELIIEDGQSDPKSSVSAFNKLVDIDKVKYIISFGSAINLALKPIAEEKKVLLFADAAHPNITKNSTFIIRHSNIANYDAKVIVEEVKKKNPKKVGIIYINDDWGLVFNREFNKLLEEFNPNINITSESYLPKDTDFRTQITKITANDPDVVIVAAFGPAAGFIIKQLKELRYNGDIFVNIGFILTPDAQKIAGEAAKGIYYQTIQEVPAGFREAYTKKYNEPPGVFALTTYTDIELLKYAIENVGEEPEKVVNFIKTLGRFRGTYEDVEITKQGDIIIPTTIKIWE